MEDFPPSELPVIIENRFAAGAQQVNQQEAQQLADLYYSLICLSAQEPQARGSGRPQLSCVPPHLLLLAVHNWPRRSVPSLQGIRVRLLCMHQVKLPLLLIRLPILQTLLLWILARPCQVFSHAQTELHMEDMTSQEAMARISSASCDL